MRNLLAFGCGISIMGMIMSISAIASEHPSRAEIETKAYALFEMVYSCAKSGSSKEACRAQLATALRHYY